MSFFKRLLAKDQEVVNEDLINESEAVSEVNLMDNSELIAVISASIATILNDSIENINIQTIRRIPQNTIAWADMGRKEQLLSKL